MFYTYSQNNSGGWFAEGDGISHFVIVEADNEYEADQVAESIGIYFDGCDNGRDCDCCGDRWSNAFDWDAKDIPEVYGRPVADGKISPPEDETHFANMKWMKGPEGYIHFADGRVEAFDY